MTKAQTMVTGAFAATRSIIMIAFCTFTTSVVMRVTRLFVEKRSMFVKEKSCIRSNIASRRFLESPEEALTDSQPLSAPNTRHSSAITMSRSP